MRTMLLNFQNHENKNSPIDEEDVHWRMHDLDYLSSMTIEKMIDRKANVVLKVLLVTTMKLTVNPVMESKEMFDNNSMLEIESYH